MFNQTKPARCQAFTLIELLVVISIILIASSIIFIGGNSGSWCVAEFFATYRIRHRQGARGQAILKNAKTRLIIYADTAANRDDDKYLRYFGIIYESEPDSNEWIAATQGTYLPEGIYFDPQQSTQNGSWSIGNKQKYQYPLIVPKAAGTGQDYYYYEFNSNGTMANGFDNAWLVVRANTLKPNASGVLDVDFDTIEEQQEYIAEAALDFSPCWDNYNSLRTRRHC